MNIVSNFKDFYDFANYSDKEDKIYYRYTYKCKVPNYLGNIGKQEVDINKLEWIFTDESRTNVEHKKINIEFEQSKHILDLINATSFIRQISYDKRKPREFVSTLYVFICGIGYRFIEYNKQIWFYCNAPKELKKEHITFSGLKLDFKHNYIINPLNIELHRTLNTPIFSIEHNYHHFVNVVINPNFKEYGLNNLFDKTLLYQNIDIFLNNVLVTQDDPNIKMSEADKLASKGMDKWSFKQQGPKTRKIKRNRM